MIREFSKGQHSEDIYLEEEYLDWFFLHYFNKDPVWWKSLDDDKVMSLMTLEREKEKEYWDNWIKILSKLLGGK